MLSRKRIALASVVVLLCVSVVAAYAMVAPAHAAPAPTVTVSGYGAPTEPLGVSGTGFPARDTVQISYDSTVVATAVVHGLGGLPGPGESSYSGTLFSAQFTVPYATTTGTHTITATDTTTSASAQTTVVIHANWNQTGFGPSLQRYNPYETAISPSNVSQLTLDWETGNTFQGLPRTITDGRLYTPSMQELDATTGTVLRTFSNLGGQNLIVRGNVVYVMGSYLKVGDINSGALLWYELNELRAFGGPNLAGGLVYISALDGLDAYNANGCGTLDCAAVWTYSGLRFEQGSTPAIASGDLYAGGTDSSDQNAKLIVLNAQNGTLLWSFADPNNTVTGVPSSPVVDNGLVFINMPGPGSQTTLFAFNANGCGAATCSPLWSATNYGGSEDLAAANGVVYVGSQDDYLYAFNEGGCGSATCAPLWKGQAPRPVTGAPAVANGVVYATVQPGTRGAFLAFNANGCSAATCAPLWSYPLAYANTTVTVSPMVANGIVYFYNEDAGDTIYAFHLPASGAQPGGTRPGQRGANGGGTHTPVAGAAPGFWRCPRCE